MSEFEDLDPLLFLMLQDDEDGLSDSERRRLVALRKTLEQRYEAPHAYGGNQGPEALDVVVRRLDEVAVFRDLFRARVERKGVHGPHYRKMLMNQAQMYN